MEEVKEEAIMEEAKEAAEFDVEILPEFQVEIALEEVEVFEEDSESSVSHHSSQDEKASFNEPVVRPKNYSLALVDKGSALMSNHDLLQFKDEIAQKRQDLSLYAREKKHEPASRPQRKAPMQSCLWPSFADLDQMREIVSNKKKPQWLRDQASLQIIIADMSNDMQSNPPDALLDAPESGNKQEGDARKEENGQQNA